MSSPCECHFKPGGASFACAILAINMNLCGEEYVLVAEGSEA